LSEFDWGKAGTNDHGKLDNLWHDKHPQYLNETRHDITNRHKLGGCVIHDEHSNLENLSSDDHLQYINNARHNRDRHPSSIVPEFVMVVADGEPVFTMDGDIIMMEVM
jgi:hypothetical protein